MRIFIKRYGYEVSNTTMHKYMNKELNLCAVIMHSKPGYKAGKKNKIFDNLLNENFTVNCKNKVWCTDFTYMRQPNGKFRYNCSIIDLYDRSAVASLNSDYINTDLAINTLKTALEKENYPKVILHSDQGVQFTSWEFVNFCKDNNITQSMSKAGCPYDNAPMERFYNTFKSSFYNVTSFSNVKMMDELTMKYINWYNYVRPHSYNNYLTPMEARYRQVFIEQSVAKRLDQYKRIEKKRERKAVIPKKDYSARRLIDTSDEKFQNSPGLQQWAAIENLKIAAQSYNEAGSLSDLEHKITVKTEAGKSAKQSVVELEHRMKDLAEIIKYAEQYKDNRSYHIGYKKAKNPILLGVCIHENDIKPIINQIYKLKDSIYRKQDEIKSTKLIREATITKNRTNNKAYGEGMVDIITSYDAAILP